MPRRVIAVSKAEIARHKLENEDGRQAFLRRRQPEDHQQWAATLSEDLRHLVIDHVEAGRPLEGIGPHHPGRPLVAQGGAKRIECADPTCDDDALHGATHCEIHLSPPPGYR